MPFTFFAHQAPVLPLSERSPLRWDGVALVAGSMAPDLAYVTTSWGYGPAGIHLWFDGHRIQNIAIVVAGACLVAWVTRRVVLPVASLALPRGGVLHLRDYRFLAEHRHRWWVIVWSAVVGVLTHLGLDAFTHPDGIVVENVGLFRTPLLKLGAHTLRLYSLLQVGGSVVLGAVAVWWLVRLGRARAFRPPGPSRPMPSLSPTSLGVFWGIVGVACASGVLYGVHAGDVVRRHAALAPADLSTVIISFCWVAFLGLVVACLAVRPFVRGVQSEAVSADGTSVAA